MGDGEFVADDNGDFLNNEFGGRTNDGCAEEFVFWIGEKFNKAKTKIVDV